MPWNIPVFDSDGKIKDARIFMPPVLSASGAPLINETTAVGAASSFEITDQQLRDLGFLLVDDFSGVDPTGVADSINGINQAMLDCTQDDKPVWFSADGIYRVSDTVRCTGWDNGFNLTIRGGGGPLTTKARPKIVLDDGATNFGDAGDIRPVVAWRNFNNGTATFPSLPSDPLDNGATYAGQANVLFDSVWEGIDIDCGDNAGALGIYMPSAQRCYAGEVTITATNAQTGWWGCLGRNSCMQNIKIIGGVEQLNADMSGRSGEGMGGGCIAGLTLVGDSRTVLPIQQRDFIPLVIVGFKITQTQDISIWISDSISRTGYGALCLIDGEITIGGSSIALDNANGHTCYFRNVYISGTDNMIKSESESTITEIGTWKRINEYCYTDQTPTGPVGPDPDNYKYKTNSMIQGSVTSIPEPSIDTDPSVSAPTVDFVARHSTNMPSVDTGPFINIVDEGAVSAPEGEFGGDLYGDDFDQTTADSLAAIESAIAAAKAAGHNRVVVPRGSYFLSATLDLDKDTVFIGVSANFCRICTKDTWQPTSNVYVMRTADDATGTCHWSHVSILPRRIDGTGGSHETPYQFDFFSYLEWRTGRNSTSIQQTHDREFVDKTFASGPIRKMAFTGNAGGKHYSLSDMGGRTFGPDPARPILISGTSEPMHLYGINCEASKAGAPDITVNMEIVNSSNLRIYNSKREGNAVSLEITNCDNCAFYGFGRQVHKIGVVLHQQLIQGSSTNILIAPSLFDQKNREDAGGETMIRQDVTSPSGVVTIPYPEGCSLYKLGTINDAAVTI